MHEQKKARLTFDSSCSIIFNYASIIFTFVARPNIIYLNQLALLRKKKTISNTKLVFYEGTGLRTLSPNKIAIVDLK